jgi:hypothetical protein
MIAAPSTANLRAEKRGSMARTTDARRPSMVHMVGSSSPRFYLPFVFGVVFVPGKSRVYISFARRHDVPCVLVLWHDNRAALAWVASVRMPPLHCFARACVVATAMPPRFPCLPLRVRSLEPGHTLHAVDFDGTFAPFYAYWQVPP